MHFTMISKRSGRTSDCNMNRRIRIAPHLLAALILVAAGQSTIRAQATATLSGRVRDASGADLAQASVVLRNALTGYEQHADTRQDGTFVISNIPFQDYLLVVRKPGFAETSQPVALRSNVPVDLALVLPLEGRNEQVS